MIYYHLESKTILGLNDEKDNPLWDKLKEYEIEKDIYKIRSVDTEDLIKDLEEVSTKQKKAFS